MKKKTSFKYVLFQKLGWKKLLLLIPILLTVLLPLFLSQWQLNIVIRGLIFSVFALSLDLLYGYTGLATLGHAGFLGIGAYTTGILVARYGITDLWITLVVSLGISMIGSAIFGVLALRVRGMNFMLVTFALSQLLYSIALKWDFLTTGGTEGVTGITKPTIGISGFTWNTSRFYFFVLICFIFSYLIIRQISRSPFGYALRGIRENEQRMEALGYNTWKYKYLVFILTGTIAGFAGVLFAYHSGIVVPANIGIAMSGNVLFMVIIGGLGTLYGPVIGAFFIILIQFYVGGLFQERLPLIIGVIFIFTMMYAREGIAVNLLNLWKRFRKKYGSTSN